MRIYIDTEFTQFMQSELLSIGLVTDDGREAYFEIDQKLPESRGLVTRSSTFVHDTVLSQFGLVPGAASRPADIGRRVIEWLDSVAPESREVDVLYDYATDLELMVQAVEGAMRQSMKLAARPLRIVPVRINGLPSDDDDSMSSSPAARSFEASFRQGGLERHHALADARALRAHHEPELALRALSTLSLKPQDKAPRRVQAMAI